MSETQLVGAILEALSVEPGVWATRNNTGVARIHGSHVRYGLGVGGADIVVVVAPYGRFGGLEAKVDDEEQSDEQVAWQRAVEAAGGFYALVRSVDDARAAVARARLTRPDVDAGPTLAELARRRLARLRAGGAR